MGTSVEFRAPGHDRPPPAGSALAKSIELAWLALGVLEGLFALRFALKLMAANPDNPFARLVYGFTELFLRPFEGLTVAPSANGMVLEVPTIFAMAVYALAVWVVIRVVRVVFDRPPSGTVEVEIHKDPNP